MKQKITCLILALLLLINCAAVAQAEQILPQVMLGEQQALKPGTTNTSIYSYTSGTVTAEGDLYVWGWNYWGQAGISDTEEKVTTPNKILSNVKKAVLGYHSAAITQNGDLYVWGYGYMDQIGTGSDATANPKPKKIMSGVADVALGAFHTVALTEDGEVYCWGANGSGQLGTGDTKNCTTPAYIMGNVAKIYAMDNRTMVVTRSGKVYGWGSNGWGQLGVGDKSEHNKPTDTYLTGIETLELGYFNTAALSSDGTLYVTGYNHYGQVDGAGSWNDYRTTFRTVQRNVADMALGDHFVAAVRKDGTVWLQGSNEYGALGCEDAKAKKNTVLSNVVQVDAGIDHVLALTQDGQLYAWGSGMSGQIGNGKTIQYTPTKIMDNVVSIAAALKNSAAVTADGQVYFWGANHKGQLGDGTTTRGPLPVLQEALSGTLETEPPTQPEQWQCPFSDVNTDAFYYDAVRWAVENGITNGISATQFAPDRPCTRGQVVTFLWRSMGSPAPKNTNNPFTDTDESAYYHNAMLWAVEQGITNGTSATAFSPDAPCTRAQVATFLHRTAGTPAYEAINQFGDVHSGTFYYDAVLWAVEQGITNGMSPGVFAPDRECTRAQIVTFLHRYAK